MVSAILCVCNYIDCDQRTLADRSPSLPSGVVAPMEEMRLQTMAVVMVLVNTAVCALESVEHRAQQEGSTCSPVWHLAKPGLLLGNLN